MRRRSKKAEARVEIDAATNKRVLQRDSWRCRNPMCRTRNNLHVHHILFRSQQGPTVTWNLVTLCPTCHDRMHGTQEPKLLIVAAGEPADSTKQPNADIGLRFITV